MIQPHKHFYQQSQDIPKLSATGSKWSLMNAFPLMKQMLKGITVQIDFSTNNKNLARAVSKIRTYARY